MIVYKQIIIEIAHRLNNYKKPKDWNKATFGKCYESIHGHSYKIEIWVDGKVNTETGMVVNFSDLSNLVKKYDHKFLNEYLGQYFVATAENFVKILIEDIKLLLKQKDVEWNSIKVRVWKTNTAYAELKEVNELCK